MHQRHIAKEIPRGTTMREELAEAGRNSFRQFLSLQAKSSVRTDIQGHFSFGKLRQSNYYLFSEYSVSGSHGFWLEKVIVDEDTKVDLTNHNSVPH